MGNSFSHLFLPKGRGGKNRPERDHGGDHKNQGSGSSGVVDIPPGTRGGGMNSPRRGSSVDWESAGTGLTDGDDTDIEPVRETDVEVVQFDKDMEKKTEHVFGSLKKGIQAGGLGLGSLKDVTTGLVDMDSEVRNFILNCDEAVWSSNDMKDLVIEYFDHSRDSLEFCRLLERCVYQAQNNQESIQLAVRILPQDRDPTEDECRRILQELCVFEDAENPFSDFDRIFTELYDKHDKFHERLKDRMNKLKRKGKRVQMARRVTTVMLTATGISLVIFATIAMALAAPLVPNLSFRAAAELPLQTMRASIHSIWSSYEERLRRETETVDTAKWTTKLAIVDLQTIQVEVTRLNFEIESIIDSIKFGKSRGDTLAIHLIVPRIKKKLESFEKQLEELSKSIKESFERLHAYRSKVLERITPIRPTVGSLGSDSTRHGGE